MQTLAETATNVHESRTTAEGYALTARVFPSGDAELVSRRVGSDTPILCGGHRRKNTEKSEMSKESLDASTKRARTTIRHKALTFMPTQLMTLTFRENVLDIDEAWMVFKYFSKMMRWKYGERWQYICVPERQKKRGLSNGDEGAVHFHLAVTRALNNKQWRALHVIWGRAVGKRGGNVDFSNKKHTTRGGKPISDPKKIGQYICKYISKEADTVGFNKKRYSSRGCVVAEPIRGWVAGGVSLVDLQKIMGCLTTMPISYEWESEDYLSITFLST